MEEMRVYFCVKIERVQLPFTKLAEERERDGGKDENRFRKQRVGWFENSHKCRKLENVRTALIQVWKIKKKRKEKITAKSRRSTGRLLG